MMNVIINCALSAGNSPKIGDKTALHVLEHSDQKQTRKNVRIAFDYYVT